MAERCGADSRRTLAAFLLVQAVVAAVCGGVVWARMRSTDVTRTEPALVATPRVVLPRHDLPQVVSDTQLGLVLRKLRPQFRRANPQINHVDHALRCWGVEVMFADEKFLSGDEMRRLLTDQNAFAAAWGDKTRPLLIAKDNGIAVRTQQGQASASHVDHTLATLAECGTPLDFPIHAAGANATLRDLLHRAIDTFDINQHEYEWTALALALYANDGRPWLTATGERVDFDRLARRIMRQRYGQGVCYGNHRLYSLTILLRVDDEQDILSDVARRDVMDHLREATRILVGNQHADGYWDKNWHNLKADAKDEDMALGGPLPRRILATGHALEWWAMAPEELHPPQDTLVRAGQWLVREIETMSDKSIADNYTFLSHAGRALSLWRGETPADTLQRLPTRPLQTVQQPSGGRE